ncbi:UNVERIFIED_CONTAM: hypothetical protein DES50_11180 [Williamsia faeni]
MAERGAKSAVPTLRRRALRAISHLFAPLQPDDHLYMSPVRIAVVVLLAFTGLAGISGTPPSAAAPLSTCGSSPLSPTDHDRIASLSDRRNDPSAAPLVQLRDHVADLWAITNVLTSHRDRRGLFALGLAAVERDAVMPLQNRPEVFSDPQWAPIISLRLLDRFLDALHAEFTGAPAPPQWRYYFDLAADCHVPGERVALAGYNSHITVDLAYATADAHTTLAQARDFFLIVDTIAAHAESIITSTDNAFGVDLGPTFRFYAFGEGLDRVVGAGRATGPMLRAADVGYNVITFNNGLALQDPTRSAATRTAITELWSTGNSALIAAEDTGLLS